MKLKHLKLTALSALAGMTFLGQVAKAATPTFNAGDLLVGFYATGGTGVNDNYVFDLGPAYAYRDNNTALFSSHLSISLGVDLASIYGANWNSRSDLFWGVLGVYSKISSANGDPGATNYLSLADPSTAPTLGSSTTRTNTANTILGLASGAGGFAVSTATSNSGGFGVDIAATNSNSFESVSSSLLTATTYNVAGSVGSGLDLYRILNSTSGASPTGTVGLGTLEGTFSINSSGNVAYASVAAVPEPSTWAMMGVGAAFLGMQVVRRNKKQVQA